MTHVPALADAAAPYALDADYDYDDDSIRGTCPEGHARMLED